MSKECSVMYVAVGDISGHGIDAALISAVEEMPPAVQDAPSELLAGLEFAQSPIR